MEFYRIGEKIISLSIISETIKKALKMRSQGCSQQEVADSIGVDRSFISRLENLGEIRKGKNIGVVGFPIKNKDELIAYFNEKGITNCLIMNEAECKQFCEEISGSDLVNKIMNLINEYRKFDTVIVLASDMRNRMIEVLLDHQVITLDIGSSPLREDVEVDLREVQKIVENLL